MKTLVGTFVLCFGAGSVFADPPFDSNLCANPGAEDLHSAGAIPGWNIVNNATVAAYGTIGLPSSSSPGSPTRGSKFFLGGSDPSSLSSLTQTIDLTEISEFVDSDRVSFRLAAYLGGVAGQDDSALVAAVFNDVAGDSVGTANIVGPTNFGRSNTTGMLLRQRFGSLPVGARTVTLVLSFSRSGTGTNEGCADDLSFSLTLNPCQADINADGGVDGDDLIQFFAAWDNNNADFNQDGGTDGDDVIAFFDRWDRGC